jgi:hypothetical protein
VVQGLGFSVFKGLGVTIEQDDMDTHMDMDACKRINFPCRCREIDVGLAIAALEPREYIGQELDQVRVDALGRAAHLVEHAINVEEDDGPANFDDNPRHSLPPDERQWPDRAMAVMCLMDGMW